MLVIARRVGQSIFIGDDVELTIIDVDRGEVKLGIKAPRTRLVLRAELRTDKPDPTDERA